MPVFIGQIMSFMEALGTHFVSKPDATGFYRLADGELVLVGTNAWKPSAKANMLGAAIADIMLWGAIFLDQIIQVCCAPIAGNLNPLEPYVP